MHKQAHLLNLKKELDDLGIHINDFLFHGTNAINLNSILKNGLRSKHGFAYGDANNSNEICFSRSLVFFSKGVSPEFGEDADVIFVFDGRELKSRLKSRSVDFFAPKRDKSFPMVSKNKSFEFEERFTLGDFKNKGETIIPPKYIKAVILRRPPIHIPNTDVPILFRTGNGYYMSELDWAEKSNLYEEIAEDFYNQIEYELYGLEDSGVFRLGVRPEYAEILYIAEGTSFQRKLANALEEMVQLKCEQNGFELTYFDLEEFDGEYNLTIEVENESDIG